MRNYYAVKSDIGQTCKKDEEPEYQKLMETHHYLGSIPKIGETLWYIGVHDKRWVALISFSAAALKCEARVQLMVK
ncbi:MAG: hypothetical protein GY786_08445 [Proteobacteria bacterium]|nr:hypothetical protein [Pseudomonadota bacterium]